MLHFECTLDEAVGPIGHLGSKNAKTALLGVYISSVFDKFVIVSSNTYARSRT